MTKIINLVPRQMDGSVTRGGVFVTGTLEGDTNAVVKGDNVALFGKVLTGYSDTARKLLFNGWLMSDPSPLSFDTYSSQGRVKLETSDGMLRGEGVQAISFFETASPNNSHEIIPPMKFAHIAEHILDSHCNHVRSASNPNGIVTDKNIDYTNSTRVGRAIVKKSQNLWGAMQKVAGGDTRSDLARCFFDRFNTYHYQKSPYYANRAALGTLTKDHIIGRPQVIIRNSLPTDRVGQVVLEAHQILNTAQPIPFQATYPASTLAGRTERITRGIWCEGQTDTSTMAQNLFRWFTRPYTIQLVVDAGLLLFGDNGQGLKLYDAVNVVYDGPAENAVTGAGVHLQINQKFYLFSYRVRFNTEGRTALATLTLEADN